ncbi:EamA family transporter [Agromyces aerolatus]|uniref:EamA family transporter n=1 Tax=Agromyces sp. LY-1074 TaxID=3074080 RepID=UPI00285B713D|nr:MULTISPECIES: EamA family transporter [unclassified Agromyces]MDR5698505.1 EamA family transporter [Agromyces sp. LY-1074]MDR5704799.1 EamA family transporter [Agromyces sp. LY-1358]
MRFVMAVLLAAVCFGTTGTAQALGPDADPASVGAARIVIGGAALALVAGLQLAAARRRRAPGGAGPAATTTVRALPAWLLVLIGAVGVLAYQPAFFAGTAANGVAVGTVVALGSAPVLTGALDWAVSRRRPGGRWLTATVVATAGVATLALATDGTTEAADPAGIAASLGAGASYAVYTIAAKALIDRGWSSTGSVGALFGVAAVAALPLLLMTDASWLATGPGLAMALWLGLVTTTLAYVLFGYGLRGLAPATVSTLTLAEPLTAGLLGVLLLGEQLSAAAALGLAVLATGILVLAIPGRATRRTTRTDAVSEGAGSV